MPRNKKKSFCLIHILTNDAVITARHRIKDVRQVASSVTAMVNASLASIFMSMILNPLKPLNQVISVEATAKAATIAVMAAVVVAMAVRLVIIIAIADMKVILMKVRLNIPPPIQDAICRYRERERQKQEATSNKSARRNQPNLLPILLLTSLTSQG